MAIGKKFILFVLIFSGAMALRAQNTEADDRAADTAYLLVVTQRAAKIVNELNIADTAKFRKVRDVIAEQYVKLNQIQKDRDEKLKILKNSGPDKKMMEAETKNIENELAARLYQLHFEYEAKLLMELTFDQLNTVKDGMTYGVFPKTYNAYLDMIPSLTETQKAHIYAWLYEAREHAMDAGSSEKKHAWFGKYKGRINNYLSAAGIDMKKAGEEWQQRIKARENAKH